MLGKDLLILNGSGGSLIAAARSCEVECDCEMIETASATSGTARAFKPGRTGWSISVGSLTESPTSDLTSVGGAAVTVQVKVRGGSAVQGSAIFRTCKITGTCGNLVQGAFVLQGTGPLSSVS